MGNKKKRNLNNKEMLSNVRKSSLHVLFPNLDECQLRTKLLTIFFAYRDDSLFMLHNYLYVKDIIDELYIILFTQSTDDVRKFFYSLYKKGYNYEKLLNNLFDVIEDRYKYEYVNKFNKGYDLKEKFVDKNGKEYDNVVDITNEDFYLFIHNISVGYIDRIGAINLTMFPGLFVDNNYDGTETISGAVISSDFIGCPRSYSMLIKNDGVYYGFNKMTKDDLIAVGDSDFRKMMVESRISNDYRSYTMYIPETLTMNIMGTYSEGRVSRECQGEKRKPDYILCFDEISVDALMHAKYYNIPIYFIDRVKLLKKQSSKIINDFEQLKVDGNISLNKLEKYFNKLTSFSWELNYAEYFLDYSDDEICQLLSVLNDLYVSSSGFLDRELRKLFSKSSKLEKIGINNLIADNKNISNTINHLFEKCNTSLSNYSSTNNDLFNMDASMEKHIDLFNSLKSMLDRGKDL